jgi:CO/xanthine dehydrogenase Mo-binding subunit
MAGDGNAHQINGLLAFRSWQAKAKDCKQKPRYSYPEDVLIPYLARRLDRPLKWIEDRYEHILNAAHARDDRHEVEVAFDEGGTSSRYAIVF